MSENIKVEFEVKGFGEISQQGYEDAFTSHEILRTKILPKHTTLEELEQTVETLLEEVRSHFDLPEQLAAKVTIRAKHKNNQLVYLG
ncbi:hypothetical protein [Halobacillus sp. A5]|uniref:hypothetical protein n=1 Tax=Halobacillus sp. A5 TaxID=2880263 RepID=UPI0020A660D7|nr:hypothetical protein [Halobacillus sp. A5]MCP3028495.1 hypothetical protein [Halobacillus sp. A5]